jgi:superfamily II DNA or RNA helicase
VKLLKKLNSNRKLRNWQEKAIRRFYALDKSDFLLVATPGGGKTFVALMIAYQLLLDGKIERIVIVTPSEHLKRQWAEAAARLGIDLDYNWQNSDGRESADYFGVAVTYHQVSFAPDLFDLNCKKKTLVIFDEIHHAGDNLEWGVNLRQAFGKAEYRIGLSGTPFRSDDNPIPFVSYENNKSRADFVYGYGEALADGVCRPIYFPTVEGNVSWIRPNGKEMECTMLDSLPRQKANERLRTALDADGDWLPDVLRQADALLTKMRLEGHLNAAGLVIALDQYHARKIAGLLKIITNETPTIAISDEDDSSREIRKFAAQGNQKRWIVAVRMVSEGVDIPRLRVGVYATTILSELFFRQVVGRFVRMIPELEEQSAALFLPFDEKLITHALSVKDEREHILQEKIITLEKSQTKVNEPVVSVANPPITKNNEDNHDGKCADFPAFSVDSGNIEFTPDLPIIDLPDGNYEQLSNGNSLNELANEETSLSTPNNLPNAKSFGSLNNGNGNNSYQRKFIIPLSSSARSHETVFNGDKFTPAELDRAETISQQIGLRVPPAQVAALIKLVAPQLTYCETETVTDSLFSNQQDESNFLLAERKLKLRKEINRLVNRLANLQAIPFEEVHRRWINERNGSKNSQATETELTEKLKWVKAELVNWQSGGKNSGEQKR